jgi:AGZA family xanthine/uracil permease-like MFS transporter
MSRTHAKATPSHSHPPWFTSGDVDGFFGLFFSGFPDLLLIVGLAPVCGFPVEFVTRQVLPGVAVSILVGNLFYAWQARRLAARTGRDDVTAIPFGVNTPTIFAYVFLIMGPVYARTHSGTLAWQAGVFASLISGAVQTAGAFCTDWLRRYTPRAALLCPLAGLALAYLCLGFIFGVFDQASIALLPMLVLFSLYGSRLKLPWRIPPGLVAIGLGALLVAILGRLHIYNAPAVPAAAPGFYLPHAVNLLALLGNREWWGYISIILPLASLDTLASLQILGSVKIAGDDYKTTPSLLMNGLGTLAAAALGSPFPTTLYVGHAAHKANGARSGYSALNGLVTLVLAEVPKAQTIAVALGLVPMLAQWATGIADTVARKAGSSLAQILPSMGTELALGGLLALGQGGLLTSMLWAAALALVIERRFAAAAGWLAAAAGLAAFGVIHAYTLTLAGVEGSLRWGAAPEFALSYAGGALFLLLCGWYARRQGRA